MRTPTNTLTRYQKEVYRYLAMGYSNAQIAERLQKSNDSIRAQIHLIYKKLRLSKTGNRRIQAARCYQQDQTHL